MADSAWHYLKEKTNAFFGVSLGFMLPQNSKKWVYLKRGMENSAAEYSATDFFFRKIPLRNILKCGI